ASDILFHGAQKMGLVQLTSGLLHTQVELFLAQGQQLLSQILSGFVTQITHFHHITVLVTNVVGTGSLAAASAKASRATSSVTTSISYSTLPGCIWATQNSTLPLPLPIRTSSGFSVIGLSGNTPIHIMPPRLIRRVMVRRAASI